MTQNALLEIVECIVEAADELLDIKKRSDIEQGELIAYVEALSIIRDACAGMDLSEIGLDFDMDAKYLISQ